MKLKINRPETYYLSNTQIENIFLGEYMPDAPCEYVKVYLLALMYAQSTGEIEAETLAADLGIKAAEVDEAWDYWQSQGLVRKTDEGIVFLSLKEDLYGNPKSRREAASAPAQGGAAGTAGHRSGARAVSPVKTSRQQRIQTMFDEIEHVTKSLLGGSQLETILGWIEESGVEPELISSAFAYSVERGKTNIRYVEAVVRNWALEGLKTKEDVAEYLEQMDQRHYTVRRVMKALGFTNRNPSEEERRLILSWTDELGCTMDEILDACSKTSGISNPNINYVNSVIRNRKAEENGTKPVAGNVVTAYYDRLREKAEAEAAERRQEIYSKIPRIEEIDNGLVENNVELTKMLMSGGRQNTDRLRFKISELEKERARLLTENRVPIDYMDARYHCALCGDTGITRDGGVCRCYEEVSRAAAKEHAGR